MEVTATLEDELREAIDGEVRFDVFTRKIYSTDASMYEIEPVGVVLPKTNADVQKTLQIANRHNAAILPRGGGTSLAGQTVGDALVLDFSKFMNQVIELNADEEWARVQPGLVQDHFNDYLSPHGFVFGPNTSTSSRATIGGMLGNNSSGSRSIVYGKTVDHVIEVSGYFADGEPFSFRSLDAASLEDIMREDSRTGRLHKALKDIVDEQRVEIADRYPNIMRRVSGYNLDELAKETQPFNLAKLMVGAEGTLAVVTEAKVRVCPKPKALGVLVVHFHSIEEALAASTTILAHDVAAIEIIDRVIIELAKQNLEAQRLMSSFVVGDPDSFLTIEFFAEDDDEAKEKVRRLHDELEAKNIGYARVPLDDPAHKQDCLNMRKAGSGLSTRTPGGLEALRIRGGLRCLPRAPTGLLPAFRSHHEEVRHGNLLLRPHERGSAAPAPAHQPQSRRGDRENGRHRRGGLGPRARIRRRHERRARRRPGEKPVGAQVFWRETLRGVRRGEAAL